MINTDINEHLPLSPAGIEMLETAQQLVAGGSVQESMRIERIFSVGGAVVDLMESVSYETSGEPEVITWEASVREEGSKIEFYISKNKDDDELDGSVYIPREQLVLITSFEEFIEAQHNLLNFLFTGETGYLEDDVMDQNTADTLLYLLSNPGQVSADHWVEFSRLQNTGIDRSNQATQESLEEIIARFKGYLAMDSPRLDRWFVDIPSSIDNSLYLRIHYGNVSRLDILTAEDLLPDTVCTFLLIDGHIGRTIDMLYLQKNGQIRHDKPKVSAMNGDRINEYIDGYNRRFERGTGLDIITDDEALQALEFIKRLI